MRVASTVEKKIFTKIAHNANRL